MLWKLTFLIFVSLLGMAWMVQDVEESNFENYEQKFKQEVECSRAGGICLARHSCPPEKVSETGHCPKQKHIQAVCCHGLSITETKCEHLGGQCSETCAEDVIITQAKDCPESQKCCPLVF